MILGYHDETDLYARLDPHEGDVILDIGCGSGMALRYLKTFRAYHGFDIDPAVVARHRARYQRNNVTCHLGEVGESDIANIMPTKVMMIGLLHHINDEQVRALFAKLCEAESIERMVTLDPIYVSTARINNLLCRFDSGNYVRYEDDLVKLVASSGVFIEDRWRSRSGNGFAHYLQMSLTRLSAEP